MHSLDETIITIVSGLPRSGTSLMMSLLGSGGMPLLVDNIRQANEDNPRGYFEMERVKKLQEDQSWLPSAQGKAVKIISALLMKLPADYQYKIIFMRRAMQEILASQRQMLIRRGQATDTVNDAAIALSFERHLQHVERWLAQQVNMRVLYVDYAALIQFPAEGVHMVNTFTGGRLNEQQMMTVIDPKLHRQRS